MVLVLARFPGMRCVWCGIPVRGGLFLSLVFLAPASVQPPFEWNLQSRKSCSCSQHTVAEVYISIFTISIWNIVTSTFVEKAQAQCQCQYCSAMFGTSLRCRPSSVAVAGDETG